ncbi:MAG: RdgB/HAM1 family non-canonical purine NTP pyrophosphatase [Cyclobacteriaceae bacterium]|jgi:XTP/dITP diphosphohydrolase|nr:RdgB/HAM1 family non-canonical purine NTP pyrophosphatase [Cyclobacteriaceae bacterium]
MKICFATHNQDKIREVKSLLQPIEIIGLDELGQYDEIPETGRTLDENAFLKSSFVSSKFKINCFADDTGLEVDSLNGEPGVYSARYAGDQKENQTNIDLLLQKLQEKSDRSARFRTVISLIINDHIESFEGIVNGKISQSRSGNEGFGYDSVFTPDGYDLTFAQMSFEEKNAISHRGRAIKKLVDYLSSIG